MNDHQAKSGRLLNHHAFMNDQDQSPVTVPTGVYHLIHSGGAWHCSFVSEDCLSLLHCTGDSFLDALLACRVFQNEEETGEDAALILRELAERPGRQEYTIIRHETQFSQRIKCALTSFRDAGGTMQLYGQMADITGPYNQISRFHNIISEYQAGLEESGKTVYRYTIQGRRAIVTSLVAERRGVPEEIEDFPDWMVASGRIAPESTEDWLSIFRAIDRGDRIGTKEIVFHLRNGALICRSLVQFISLSDMYGRPDSALITYEDITARYEYDRMQSLDRAGLLQVAQMSFPEILSINLTKKTYHIIQYYSAASVGTPDQGQLDDLLNLCLPNIAKEEQQAFQDAFFYDGLMRAVREGKEQIRLAYRRIRQDGIWHWTETTVVRQENPYDDDILFMVISRSIDEEKHRELQLREKVRLNEEELQITRSQISNHISYYDLATGTLTTLPATAKLFGLSVVMENYPESFIANAPVGYPAGTGEILRGFIAAIRRGEPSGTCEYPTVTAQGEPVYLRRTFVNIFNDMGEAVRAVITSEDITEEHTQLVQDASDRIGLMKVTQIIFPEILSCNLTKNTCTVLQSTIDTRREIPLDDFLNSRLEDIAPEDREAFRRQFFRSSQLEAIEQGKERFQLVYRKRRPDGSWHWVESTALIHRTPHSSDILSFAVSRNVDKQKAEEELLQQALAASTDKLEGWLYYNSLSSQNYPGLVYVNYDDERPSPYAVGALAKRLDCPAKELALSTCFRIPKSDRGRMQRAREDAKRFNESSFRGEYRVETDRGEVVWISNHAVSFTDRDGNSGHIHFLTDVTYEHSLMEQLRVRLEDELKKQQEVFRIVSVHSNRTLYSYDLSTGITTPLDEENAKNDILKHLYLDNYTNDGADQNTFIMPESLEHVKQFFADIHAGVPSGALKLHIRLKDGQLRWYHFYSSTLFTDGKPATALISVEDITERHEQELGYRRYVQSVMDDKENSFIYLESCLICQAVEVISGSFLSQQDITEVPIPYLQFAPKYLDPILCFEDQQAAIRYFSPEHLLEAYAQGEQLLTHNWKVFLNDGSTRWLDSEVALIPDPYNDHIKAVIRLMDITESHEEHLSILQQANYDTMTGLLRRGAGEARIREHLSNDQVPGILLALDLDDLKGMNDTLGHAIGDEALIGISNTLKEHFRKDDLLIRYGGDEFLVFLPGAGMAVHSIELSLTALLRKLSAIMVGHQGERSIHCSIGCAVVLPDTDTFESLYQRADIALYHVKRNGKNNFAFFESAMLDENYRFRIRQAVPINTRELEADQLRDLLSLISAHYPGVVHFDLSQDRFCILCTGLNADLFDMTGNVDTFWENWRGNVHPDDWESVFTSLSRAGLISLYAAGKHNFTHYYRNLESEGYVRTEVSVHLYPSANGNMCAFLFFRWETMPEKELEIRRLRKILSLYEDGTYEYICLINVQDGSYSVFNMHLDNSHAIPESASFDTVTRHIRDTAIPPEDRETYYKNAALEAVLAGMKDGDGSYTYRYTMTDGFAREAVFSWFEDTRSELLMTVRKL